MNIMINAMYLSNPSKKIELLQGELAKQYAFSHVHLVPLNQPITTKIPDTTAFIILWIEDIPSADFAVFLQVNYALFNPSQRWILVSNVEYVDFIGLLISLGFRAIINTESAKRNLKDTLKLVLEGCFIFCSSASNSVVAYLTNYTYIFFKDNTILPEIANKYNLSRKEVEIAQQLMYKKTYKEIANMQFVSLNTIRFHIKSIYLKVGVHSKEELILKIKEDQNLKS